MDTGIVPEDEKIKDIKMSAQNNSQVYCNFTQNTIEL